MSHVRYAPFLSVSILHPYYADKLSSDFEFVPMPSTIVALATYGLRISNTGGQLMVAQERDAADQPTSPLDGLVDLFFVIRLKTDLVNITQSFATGKYFFTNLKENGAYQPGLSKSALVSAADQLPPVGPLQQTINFLPGTYSSIVFKRIVPGQGFRPVLTVPVAATATNIQTDLAIPGLYQLESQPAGGGAPVVTQQIFSDELAAAVAGWAVLHLQLKPGDANLSFTITLSSRQSSWQYFLIEPKKRSGGSSATAINPNSLAMSYALPDGSRYPAGVNMDLIDPVNYPQSAKDYVASVMADPAIREVYLFQSDSALAILDGPQPQLKVVYTGADLVSKAIIPTRTMINTTIIYKL